MLDLGRVKFEKTKEITLDVDNFRGGVNTLVSAPKLKKNEAVKATNLMLVEDGLWTPRWGTAFYGEDAGGSSVDGFVEYRKSDGSRELIVFANDLAQKSSDGTSWATIDGYTPTAGYPVEAIQIGNYLYACNGEDVLARYGGTDFSVYTPLSAPTGLAGVRGTLTDGDYTYYCQVTAHNEIGETVGATEASVAVNKERDAWTGDEKITWSWDTVTGATRYSIYLSDEMGYECKVKEVEAGILSWDDTGADAINPYIDVPDDNTTGGPLFAYMWVAGNRLWGCGDPDNPWRVYFTGKGARMGIFSYAYGGGWIDLERGGKALTKGGAEFQGKSYVFCPTPEGRGNVWEISLSWNSTYSFWDPTATKAITQISSLAPRGIVQVENDVFFVTKRGVYILGNEPNVTAPVLRTNELSARIRDYINGISNDDLGNICAYYKEGRVFFSFPGHTFVYDRERLCWYKDWTVGTSCLGEFTDNSGKTHFLGGMTSDGFLVEFSPNYRGDLGVAFKTVYLSPRFIISDKWMEFAKIKRAFIRLRNATGTINFEVRGSKYKKQFSTVAASSILSAAGLAMAGLGWDVLGTVLMGDTEGIAGSFREESLVRYIKVNEKLRDVQFRVTTEHLSDDYVLLGIQAEGVPLKVSPPSDWKLA